MSSELWKKRTKGFVVISILVIGVYDVIALYAGGSGATISRWVIDWPPFPVLTCGMIIGHLFWPQERDA